jgi:hypothetical protein
MESRSRLVVTIAGIVAGSLLAFCCGLVLTVMVIVPAREGRDLFAGPTGGPTTVATPSVGVGPIAKRTPVSPSPAPSYSVFTATPTPRRSASSPAASATATPSEQPPPPSTPSPQFAFFYVEGSRVEELQCSQPYLQGWVRDAAGAPLNGVTVEWKNWNNVEHALSGDRQYLWQDGEFKFTYYGQDPGAATDFVLQVVESADNPIPLSEPLLIHYAGCATMGQITNIVFKQY